VKINIAQRFKHKMNRAVSTVPLALETVNNINFQGGEIPLVLKQKLPSSMPLFNGMALK